MGYKCSEDLKNGLLAVGKWSDACRMMEDIKGQMGCNAPTAMRKAVEMLAPELIGLVRKSGRQTKAAQSAVGESLRSLADARMAGKNRRVDVGGCAVVPHVLITKQTFVGKDCSGAAAIDWAFTNLNTVDVMPEDAPSAVAWNLLAEMRTSPSTRADVIGKWMASSLKIGEKDEGGGRRFDGEGEYDINAAIVRAMGGAEVAKEPLVAAEASAPEVVGVPEAEGGGE